MSDEPIRVVTPQFERVDDVEPRPAPAEREDWESLRDLEEQELSDLGLQQWSEDLWLFPFEWYDDVPNDLVIESINGERGEWGSLETSRDKRFGALAYGVRTGRDS
jgi:hypothetical protein